MGVYNFVTTLPVTLSLPEGALPRVSRKKPLLERIFEDGHYTLWGK